MFQYGGTLDKFIGDAVMAFFGAPMHQADHAERSVRAALEIQRRIATWNAQRLADGLDEVQIRVAINSGPVVVGDIGSETRVDYTILGNTVNVAARLEEMVAKPGWTVIGHGTERALGVHFQTELLGNIQLRGLQGKLPVYRVLGDEPVEVLS